MALLAAVLILAATAGTGVAALRMHGQLAASGDLLLRSEMRIAELRRIERGQRDLADVQKIAEGTVEGGTRAVQFVHRGIAAIPFTILEAIPPTRPAARVVRVTHDLIADSVYGAISLANRGLGRLIRWGRSERDGPA